MYKAYVTTLKNLRKHPNADRLQLAECFGNTVCVDMSAAAGEIGVYFPEGGQLSVEFCEQNNLVRKKDENGNNIGGYLDPNKRNITTINLRGEKSDGLFLPISCIVYTGANLDDFNEGDIITVVNGHDICTKYIPKGKCNTSTKAGNKTRKKKVNICPMFAEHADTEQLAYNISAFKPGDIVDITLKMHGTSQRTGFLPVLKGYNDSIGCKLYNRFRKVFDKNWENIHDGEPVYYYDYVCGTRRVMLDETFGDGGFYGSNDFRQNHHTKFFGKLWKGETVYYEVVGYVNETTPIMPSADNKKVNDKEFVKQYGKQTIFSYGCEPGESEMYVYRMTITNEDGDVVEYTPEFMRYRCEQMGVKCVPHFGTYILKEDDDIKEMAEWFYDGVDPIGKTHIREGVVCRIVNRPKFTAYKHKNDNFKILSGIAIAAVEETGTAATADMLEEM